MSLENIEGLLNQKLFICGVRERCCGRSAAMGCVVDMGNSLDKKEVPDPSGWEPQGRKVVSAIAAAMTVRRLDTGRTSG